MKNIPDTQTVQSDFERIALLFEDKWNHNSHYHFLLKYVPSLCENELEIGYGTSELARSLTQHASYILALDLSPRMIQIDSQGK